MRLEEPLIHSSTNKQPDLDTNVSKSVGPFRTRSIRIRNSYLGSIIKDSKCDPMKSYSSLGWSACGWQPVGCLLGGEANCWHCADLTSRLHQKQYHHDKNTISSSQWSSDQRRGKRAARILNFLKIICSLSLSVTHMLLPSYVSNSNWP